jgi:hypothetical protein
VRVLLRETTPGEFSCHDCSGRAHDGLMKALRAVAARGAEWDVVEELARGMEADYKARLERLQAEVRGLVPKDEAL